MVEKTSLLTDVAQGNNSEDEKSRQEEQTCQGKRKKRDKKDSK